MAQKKVLIVEDDAFLIRAYQTKLKDYDLEVEVVTDGSQALAALEKAAPDVILLDLIMPRKDGFEVLQEIKNHKDWRNIPIVVASNMGQAEDVARVKNMGIDDYLVKSDVSLQEVIDRVMAAIRKK